MKRKSERLILAPPKIYRSDSPEPIAIEELNSNASNITIMSCSVCNRAKVPGLSKDISFHPFPDDRVLRKSWVDFVNKPGWEPTASSTICSIHFNIGCFKAGSLKAGSVPTQKPAGTIEDSSTPAYHSDSYSNDPDEEKIKLRKTIEEMRKMMCEMEQEHRDKVQKIERTMKQLQEDHKATIVKLENQIDHLKNMDIIKSKKIRKVQIKLWGQRNRAKKLTTKLMECNVDSTLQELEDMYVVPSSDEDES